MDRLVAEDLVVSYRDADGRAFAVLDGVSMHPVPGAVTAVTGPSGSGKSTLLNALSGMIRPDSGRVTFAGTEVSALSEGRRDRWRRDTIGLVFQGFHLIDELSPRDNVVVAAWFDRLSAKGLYARADALLDRLGVPTNRKSLKGLSRGEQQRVAIARALLFDPPVILADEPTASLDGAAGASVIALLRDLAHEEGRSVVVVSHDPELVAAADTVLDLSRGHLAARRTTEAAA